MLLRHCSPCRTITLCTSVFARRGNNACPGSAHLRTFSAAVPAMHTSASVSTARAGQSRMVLTRNGVPLDMVLTAGDLLRVGPRGAYTSGRTVRQTSVFGLEQHLKRLADSCATVGHNIGASHELMSETEFDRLAPRVKDCIRASLLEWLRQCPEDEREAKLTVLLGLGPSDSSTPVSDELKHNGRLQVFVQVCPLTKDETRGTRVVVLGAPRDHATAKDSSWVLKRRSLEEVKTTGADIDEVVLMADNGDVVEGTQTNFFAVQGGKVYTAESGVLHGTVRRTVLDVCKAHGIPVVLEPPNLAQAHTWEGALLSSTSRLAHPLTHITIPSTTMARLEHYKNKVKLAEKLTEGSADDGEPAEREGAGCGPAASGAPDGEPAPADEVTIELPSSTTVQTIVAGVEAGILARSTEVISPEDVPMPAASAAVAVPGLSTGTGSGSVDSDAELAGLSDALRSLRAPEDPPAEGADTTPA